MFHDIDRHTAQQSFQYLKRKYNIISLDTFIAACQAKSRANLPKKAAVITFDDGHKQNYDIYPVLKQLGVPATIFLCSGIVNTNRHYWFKHKDASFTSSDLKKLSNQEKLRHLAKAGFWPEKEFSDRQALNKAEILEMKPFINFQAHTVFHPCLPQCYDEEARWEIEECKNQLESDYGLNINALAFPNGDYAERDIQLLKAANFQAAVTVDHGLNDIHSDPFRLKRLSTNDSQNMDEFIVKVSGLWGFIKSLSGKKRSFGWTDQVAAAPSNLISNNKL